jgi:hypothetical protein
MTIANHGRTGSAPAKAIQPLASTPRFRTDLDAGNLPRNRAAAAPTMTA